LFTTSANFKEAFCHGLSSEEVWEIPILTAGAAGAAGELASGALDAGALAAGALDAGALDEPQATKLIAIALAMASAHSFFRVFFINNPPFKFNIFHKPHFS